MAHEQNSAGMKIQAFKLVIKQGFCDLPFMGVQ
jgi:hypothetical protein